MEADELRSKEIDWSKLTSCCEVECKCGAMFHSPTKFDGKLVTVISREACPGCGKYSGFRKVSSGSERFSL